MNNQKTISILRVGEDNPDPRALHRLVAAQGLPWNCERADGVVSARQRLTAGHFDLVLVDDALEDGSAFDLLDGTGSRVMILLAGVGREESVAKALRSGAVDYLIKDAAGIYLESLPARVEIALRQRDHKTALVEKELRVRDLFDASNDLIQSSALDGTILYVNRAWRQMLGYTEEEVQSLNLFRILHADSAGLAEALFKKIRAGQQVTDRVEWSCVAKDGRRICVEGRVSVRQKNGVTVAIDGIFRDLTEKNRQESRLRLLDTCLSKIDDIVMITEVEPQGDIGPRIVYVNDAFEKITGYTREDALGKSPRFLQGPETDMQEMNRVRQRLERREPISTTLAHYKKNGEKFYNEMAIVPVEDESGRHTNWVSIQRDVTERQRTEAKLKEFSENLESLVVERSGALAESEARFRQMAEAMEEVFWLYDLNFKRWIYVSPAYEKIWNQTVQSLQENPGSWMESIHLEDRQRVEKTMFSGEGRAEKFQIEFRITRPDRDTRWVRLTGYGVKNKALDSSRIAGSAVDVTAQKDILNQLNRTQRLESIGHLASGIAHDLNNALAPMLLANELIRAEYPKAEKYVSMIESSAKRSADMVRQLLTFARGYGGEKAPLKPGKLLKEMATILSGTFPKNIQLVYQFKPDSNVIEGDATQLHQVLLNLCVNARDAMPNGGVLTLESDTLEIDAVYAAAYTDAKPGRYVTWRVKDTGVGIPAEIMDRIFDPFFSTKGPNQGTGLGLSTVLGIVRSHGGFLRVYSTPGQGSLFAVYLPVMEMSATDTEFEFLSKRVPSVFRGNGELILLVDDEANVRHISKAVLESMNFKVITANDGTEGLTQVAAHRSELRLIITDQHMPHLDGIGFVRVLKYLMPQAVVMVTSGRMDEGLDVEFQKLGVKTFLNKPFTHDKLAAALKTIFSPPISGNRAALEFQETPSALSNHH